MDIADEHLQACDLLLARRVDSELASGLDCVDRVGARVGEPDHLRVRRLRLQQVRREVRSVHRMLRFADHLASRRVQGRSRIVLQRRAERVVDGQEVPRVIACARHRLHETCRQRIGVVRVLDRVRRARLVAELGRARAACDRDPVLLLRHVRHRERDGRRQQVLHHIDLLVVEPFTRDRRGDVGLVLVIGADHLDRRTEHLAAEIVDGHLRRDDRAFPADVGKDRRHVGEHADLHHAIADVGGAGRLRSGCARHRNSGGHRGARELPEHGSLLDRI
ncbi:hypothetical protein AWB67_07368 [Caballeronia terrestris]|uniref:Uncharacterized protein n=1 Tax=Caballeronia terrestris TaxID=1226301 RepID=A0A158L1I9_9BURK|nr:hypothetical protein AWB67_07368 [Caballeronia terrestris]